MKQITIKTIIFLLGFLLLAGCINPFLSEDLELEKSDNARYDLSLSIDGEEITKASTLVPTIPTNIFYRISFSGPETLADMDSDDSSFTLNLLAGSWTISIKAIDKDTDLVIADGSGSFEIPTVLSGSIELNTKMTEDGKGKVDFNLDYTAPATVPIGSITGKLRNCTTSAEIVLTVNEDISSPVSISGEAIPSGYYFLILEFKDENNTPMTPYNEIVHIYDNLTTFADIVIEASDFTDVPDAPENFQTEISGSDVILTWINNASFQTGSLIERKEDSGTFSTIETLNDYTTLTYTDSTTESGKGYVYRVSAFNDYGSSVDSPEAVILINPQIVYVSPNGTGSGISWEYPIGDLQKALDMAALSTETDKEVWVAEGTYHPNSMPNISDETDPRYNHFSLKNGVALYGGFIGTESSLVERDPWAHPAILSGDFNEDDIVSGSGASLVITNNDENAYHVFYHPSEAGITDAASIDGFTISRGNADLYDIFSNFTGGGGMFCEGCSPSFSLPLIDNCNFVENYANSKGGGLYTSNTEGRITNCVFIKNIGSFGGGFYSFPGNNIANCIFYGNYSDYDGAGIDMTSNDSASIENSIFIDNYTENDGGAICSSVSSFSLTNSILWNNNAGGEGSEYYQSNRFGTVSNCLINNYPLSCELGSNCLEVVWSDIFTSDPLFTDISNPLGIDNIWTTDDDGLKLLEASYLIDCGINTDLLLDIAGNERLQGNAVDIGAYESPFIDSSAPAEVSEITSESSGGAIILHWTKPDTLDFSQTRISWTPSDGIDQPIALDRDIETINITGLTNGTEYTFSIMSEDYAGNISTGLSTKATPVSIPLPEITNITNIHSSKQIVLFWADPSDCNFESVSISWTPESEGTQPLLIPRGTEEAIISGLTKDTNYTFTFKIVDYAGSSSAGTEASIETKPVIFVDCAASGAENGSSWTDAFTDLSLAFTYATEETEIWVADGTYHPTSMPNITDETNQQYNHFSLKNGVALYGGFTGIETEREERDPWGHPTILSGDFNDDDEISGSGSTLGINNVSDNAYHVFYHPEGFQLNDKTIIDGFEIRGGRAKYKYGGGMYNYGSSDNHLTLQIRNCLFIGNNSSYKGGGIYNHYSDGIIENCIFIQNYSDSYGGGLWNLYDTNILNCIFIGNKGAEGGGVYMRCDEGAYIKNSTFINNYASESGGAIYSFSPYLVYANNILWNNSAVDAEPFNEFDQGSYTITVQDCLIQGYPESCSNKGTGWSNIISTDPLFTDISNPIGADNIWFTSDDGLILGEGSPAIDAGDSSLLPLDVWDMDGDADTGEVIPYDITGNVRVQGTVVDLGAYEKE